MTGTMPKLYQVKDSEPPQYGTFLTTDSKGRMVLEMKPSGGIQAHYKDKLEEVLPYTVELTQVMRQDAGDKGKSMHVLAVEGQVAKDEFMLELATGLLWRVTMLNSKCRSARATESKWARVPMELVQFGADTTPQEADT